MAAKKRHREYGSSRCRLAGCVYIVCDGIVLMRGVELKDCAVILHGIFVGAAGGDESGFFKRQLFL